MAGLAVIFPPFPDESLAGYVVRLAERNAFPSPSWMEDLLAQHSGCAVATAAEAARDPRIIRALEALARLPEKSLNDRSFTARSYGYARRDRPPTWDARPLDAYQRYHPMVCPACLEEAPYAKKQWDLSHLPVCTQHGLVLVDTCPRCGERMGWRRTKVAHCEACGADLRRSERVSVAPEVLAVASRGLAHLPLGTDRHIELMSPEDLFRLVRLLALMKPGHRLEEATKENFNKLSLGNRLQALRSLAECWNGGFLDSARIRQALLENWRHLQAFKANFYIRKELRRWVDTADLDDPVAGMILHDTPDADADKAYHLYAGNPPRFTDPKEIARFLGVEQPVLECLRWRYLLKYPTPRHLAYDADDVLECRDFLDDLMTPEEVDQIVGAPGISRLLEQSRLIEPWCRQAKKRCYAPDSLASLFDAVRIRVLPKSCPEPAIRLDDIAQGDPGRLMGLISMVLGGSLPIVEWWAPYKLVDVWVVL